MKLIHVQALNCYYDCVLTVAGAFGLDYVQSFSGLWSEGDLCYDPICKVFLTQRMPAALEIMGMKLEQPHVTGEERERAWARLPVGGYTLVGMDGRLIPWNPLYQLQNGPHYFIVQKTCTDPQICFDPTYGLSGELLDSQELVVNAYALIPIEKIAPGISCEEEHAPNPLLAQAREVLKRHPVTMQYFLEQVGIWLHGTEDTVLLPAKFVDALLTNRLLYRRYLEERHTHSEETAFFQDKRCYEAWKAVKYGFYKATLTKQNPAVVDDALDRFVSLFQQEIAIARRLLEYNGECLENEAYPFKNIALNNAAPF